MSNPAHQHYEDCPLQVLKEEREEEDEEEHEKEGEEQREKECEEQRDEEHDENVDQPCTVDTCHFPMNRLCTGEYLLRLGITRLVIYVGPEDDWANVIFPRDEVAEQFESGYHFELPPWEGTLWEIRNNVEPDDPSTFPRMDGQDWLNGADT